MIGPRHCSWSCPDRRLSQLAAGGTIPYAVYHTPGPGNGSRAQLTGRRPPCHLPCGQPGWTSGPGSSACSPATTGNDMPHYVCTKRVIHNTSLLHFTGLCSLLAGSWSCSTSPWHCCRLLLILNPSPQRIIRPQGICTYTSIRHAGGTDRRTTQVFH